MRVGYKAILTSPDFLYLREKPANSTTTRSPRASPIFLWSSMPDPELLSLAQPEN